MLPAVAYTCSAELPADLTDASFLAEAKQLLEAQDKKRVSAYTVRSDSFPLSEASPSFFALDCMIQVQKLEKDAVKNWDKFYMRNQTNFFKDRHASGVHLFLFS